jgi:hypothetical protein
VTLSPLSWRIFAKNRGNQMRVKVVRIAGVSYIHLPAEYVRRIGIKKIVTVKEEDDGTLRLIPEVD